MTPESNFRGYFFGKTLSLCYSETLLLQENTKSVTLFFSLLFFKLLTDANFTQQNDVFGVFEIPNA